VTKRAHRCERPYTCRVARDREILEAAEKLFYERSFDGVGVDDIGKAAGMSGSAIYRHFSGKDEILAALFDQVIDALLIRIGEPNPDPREELHKLVHAFVEFTMRYERLAAIWIREQRSLSDRYRREHNRRYRRFADRWIVCLEQCYPGRVRDELVTAARAVQLLLMSQALRPPGGRRARNAETMLTDMALASLGVLQHPAVEAAG
jgi:AcrR family transcriptional regulator